MWRSRMFWRLFGTFSILLLAAIGLLGLVVIGRVEKYFLNQLENSLRSKAVLLREAVRGRTKDQAPLLQKQVTALRPEIAARITLLARDGRVLADSAEDPERMENHADRPEVREARRAGFGSATRYSTTLSQSMMYVALPTGTENEGVAFVRVAVSIDSIQDQLAWLRSVVWTTAVSTGFAALILAIWLARHIIQPLQELTGSAERIAEGNYGHKVYAAGRDEVATLARTFNHMSERLDSQFAQLAEDRHQLQMILGGMVEGVVALDADQRILFANERAEELLGFRIQANSGRKYWEVIRQRGLQEVVKRALAESDPYEEELHWNGPATKSLTVHAARLPGSPPQGAVLVLHDTSELRRLERVRQEFVANASHELKTPLSVIKACVETLLDGAMDDPAHRVPFLEKIEAQANRLHALVLDLLSLARIESGMEALEIEPVPLRSVVTSCLERHRARAESKSLILEAVPPVAAAENHEHLAAWADEEAVAQILDNLVDNAVKYTPEKGRIWVRWRAETDRVCLEVEDTGIGIPDHDLPRIFERFYRVDRARSRELGGTGLGLSIVKHLVQAMHGSIQAASRLGQGTTFSVWLPRASVS